MILTYLLSFRFLIIFGHIWVLVIWSVDPFPIYLYSEENWRVFFHLTCKKKTDRKIETKCITLNSEKGQTLEHFYKLLIFIWIKAEEKKFGKVIFSNFLLSFFKRSFSLFVLIGWSEIVLDSKWGFLKQVGRKPIGLIVIYCT